MKHSGIGTARKVAVASALALSAITIASTGAPAQAADPIPDEGLGPLSVPASPLVSERTEVLEYGVSGINSTNDSFPNTNIRVTSFAELNDVMYVGGKFTSVERATDGQRTAQQFLAAFDRDTGAWIDTFRPTLDGNVWDLATTDDGRLIVAGQFTNVNDESNTTSVASLDPVTGAITPGWRVDLELSGSSDRPLARTLDIEGDTLYIGGNFTQITGSDGVAKNAGRIARVNVTSGNVDGSFLPNIDGIVFDIDATADRVYAAGNFFYTNGEWSPGVSRMLTNGDLVPGLQPWVRTQLNNSSKWYQQAILAVGDDVWQAGSQHNRQVYRNTDWQLLRSWVSDPWGDGQALAELNGVVYTGSHANGSSRLHRDAISWPGLSGATSSQPIKWMSAFDSTAHEQISWVPQVGTSNGEGSWELFGDSTDCLWSGGDFNRGSYDGNTPRYASGFAKFCAADATPPAPPTNPTATLTGNGINLAWEVSPGDDRGGEVRYELLKNDSVFASYISIDTFRDASGTVDDRYFVRAMDYTGNRSATTQMFGAATDDTTRPSTPRNLTGVIEANGDVTLTWTPSTDNVAVTGYTVLRNGTIIDTVTNATTIVATPASGDHWYQVRAFDDAGNQGFKTSPIKITIEAGDTTHPSTPQNLTGVIEANGDVTLIWTPSTDNVAVTGYTVLRNGTIIDTVSDANAVIPAPADGASWFQVRALDAAGNESFKTPPIAIDITGDDTNRPTTPQDLAGLIEPSGDITLTWAASTDNVGVTSYAVLRNGNIIDTVTDASALVVAPPTGSSWFQVRAFDAAGNESFKTPPLQIDI